MTALRSAAYENQTVRTLDDRDLGDLRRLVDIDRFTNAVLSARLERAGSVRAERLGGDVVGVGVPGGLRGACYVGGNVLPVGGGPDEWQLLGRHLATRRRTCSSIIADADALRTLWPALSAAWGAARLVRPCQPLLMTSASAGVPADPSVRRARDADLDRYLPASLEMLRDELGIAPFTGSSRAAYRARLAGLIGAGRAFVRLDEHGEVVFKAELAAITRHTSHVQGVWVRPDCRGRGIATAAMAAVIGHALRLAPSVSLYVNDFNQPARRLYERLGMRQVGTLATVLF